jgi:hypothetical protein
MSQRQLILTSLKGPVRQKYEDFVYLGEPGYAWFPEVHYAGQPNTGKTSAMADAMLISALEYPGAPIALARDTAENIMSSVFGTLMKRAKAIFDAGIATYVSSRNQIEFKNGSFIRLIGLDVAGAEDRLLGMEPFRIFIDQLEGIQEDLLNTSLTRIARTIPIHEATGLPGKPYIKTTANFQKGRNWIWKRTELDAEEVQPDYFVTTVTGKGASGADISAQRLLIKVRYSEVEAPTDDYDRVTLLAGGKSGKFFTNSWAENEGLLLREYKPEIHEVADFPFLDGGIGYFGVDHGIGGDAHPTVAVFGVVNYEGQFGLCREYVSRGVRGAKQNAMYIASVLADLYDQGVTRFVGRGDASMWRRERDLGSVAAEYDEVFADLPFDVTFEPATKKRDAASASNPFLKGYSGLSRMKEILQSRTYGGKPRLVVSRKDCPYTVSMLSEFDTEKLFADVVPMTDVFDANRYIWPAVQFGGEAKPPSGGRQAVLYGGIT